MSKKVRLLITGGAGFIGSNLVEHFLKDERVELVRILDNLSTGNKKNIKDFLQNPKLEFIKGDIRDYTTCLKVCEGINKISHQAALGSVPRSIKNPLESAEVNILGTLNLLHASIQTKVERVVLAFSSSTYGDHHILPKVEDRIGSPLSPYAVTKSSIEQFADVFGKTYGLEWIGLRYFNVFGPKQDPENPYAAVIPIFFNSILKGKPVVINGDGETTRDFTYVSNIISINELSLFTENKNSLNKVYNAACSKNISLNQIVKLMEKICGKSATIIHAPERIGDIKHSKASINKAIKLLKYKPLVDFEEGLALTYNWFKSDIV